MPKHYDVFLSYHWRDQVQVHALAEMLRGQNLHVFLDRWYLTAGQSWLQELEQALSASGAVAVCIGQGEMGPWQQREKNFALDRQAKETGFAVIPVLLPGAEPPLGFLKQNTWVDFRSGLAEDLPLRILAAAVRGEPPDAVLHERQREILSTLCPYKGLQFFREEDAELFFGRDSAIDELHKSVQARSFVFLVGPSGSGKSSVVRAGLVPKLRRETHEPWEIVTMIPGDRPFHNLAAVLLPLLETDLGELDRLRKTGELAVELQHGSIELRDVVARILEKQAGTRHLLLVVDQWEELYTYQATGFHPNAVELATEVGRNKPAPAGVSGKLTCPMPETVVTRPYSGLRMTLNSAVWEAPSAMASQFIDLLLAATQQQQGSFKVVASLRADFMGRALEHRGLSEQMQKSMVMLGPMADDELQQAIEKPAQLAGVEFQEGLAKLIVDDLAGEPGSLPLLEFCLTRLYETRQNRLMSHFSYEAIGKVSGAIIQRADAVLAKIEDRQAVHGDLARDIFLQLVQLGEGVDDTRRRVFMDELGEGGEARAVVKELADARLVVTGYEPGSGKDTVEVAHEALIRRWPTLRGWLERDREKIFQRREIERAAKAWAEHQQAAVYRWPDERVMLEAAPVILDLQCRFPVKSVERAFLGPLTVDELLTRLDDPATTHAERAMIGDRLALLPGGDPRPGVGLRADGLPDIVWKTIPGGNVALELEAKGWTKRFAAKPVFKVQEFQMAQYPVTVAQWRAFVEAAEGYDLLVRKPYGAAPGAQRGQDNQPAVNLAWVEAVAFCQWLSNRLGYELRLPTEWEWQQAATGGKPHNQYPWGPDWDESLANTYESNLGRILAVGLYPSGKSEQNVMDLSGNVWEWCLNQYDQPKQTAAGGEARRVLRGGSWDVNQVSARCAYRDFFDPVFRSPSIGFRLVCGVSPPS